MKILKISLSLYRLLTFKMNCIEKATERNSEIVTFFYTIFSKRIRDGVNSEEARKQAYDAVTLRYEISKGRLLNIISERRNSQKVNMSSLQQNAIALIKDLQTVNEGLDNTISKNERLISLLKEFLEND